MADHNQAAVFEIRIKGPLNESWARWLGDRILSFSACPEHFDQTIVKVAVSDQVALRGTLNKLWDLNLTVLAVGQVPQIKSRG